MWDVDGLLNCMTTCTGVQTAPVCCFLFFQFGWHSPLATVLRVSAGQHASAQNVRDEHCCRRFTVPIQASILRYPRWSPARMQHARRPCPARAIKQIPSQRSPAVAADAIHSRSCTRRKIAWTLLYTASEFEHDSHLGPHVPQHIFIAVVPGRYQPRQQ
jgi:hypothetical protein